MNDMKKRHKMKLAIVMAFTLLLSTSLSACATFDNFKGEFFDKQSELEATVRIGVFEPLSGKDKEKGELEVEGIELAHEMFPTALGKQVELVKVDNKSDINVAESAAKELVEKRVAMVLGSYGSANSLVAVKYFEDAKIPAIAITNTNPLVTSNNPYYFRVCLLESFQGVALAKYAVEKLGTSSAAIMRPLNDDYATAVAQRFSDKYIQMTGNPSSIVVTCDYDTGHKDFKDELQKIKDSGAQVVFLPAKIDDASQIIKQAKALGVNVVFLGTDHWDSPDLIKALGKDAAEGVTYSTIFDPNTDTTVMSDNFKKAYRAKYGDDAVPESAVALAFDAYMIAIDTLNKTGSALDGEKLKDTLTFTKSFPGSSGTITFDINGDPIKSVVVEQIHNGQGMSVYTMEPALVNMGV